jgi:hypothetical protein
LARSKEHMSASELSAMGLALSRIANEIGTHYEADYDYQNVSNAIRTARDKLESLAGKRALAELRRKGNLSED